jgi:hypothetical protein
MDLVPTCSTSISEGLIPRRLRRTQQSTLPIPRSLLRGSSFNNSLLQILRVSSGGGFESIAGVGASVPPGTDWIRYEFIGKGSELTGRVYTLDNPDTPFAEVTVTDDSYPSGVIGLAGLDSSVDVEYDNFEVLDPNDPDGCDEPEEPICFTDTFDGESSLDDWLSFDPLGTANALEISEEGALRFSGGSLAGAYFKESLDDFRIEVDVDYKNTVGNNTTVVGRLTFNENGSSNSYGLLLDNGSTLRILRLSRGTSQDLASTTLPQPPPDGWLRYVFTGVGNQLTGRVYALDDLATPLAEVTASYDEYPSGFVGVATQDSSVDTQIDNIQISDPNKNPIDEEATLVITHISSTGDRSLQLEVTGTEDNKTYEAEASTDLRTWSPRKRFQGSTVDLTTDGRPAEHYRVKPAEGEDYQQEVGAWLAGSWHGLTDIFRSENGQPVPGKANNLVLFTSDGQFMVSTSAELGNATTFVANPFFGQEGQPELLPYSLEGVHTAIYGNWKAAGPDSFEGYGSWLFHRSAEFDSPPLSPAPLNLVGRVWIRGERTEAGLQVTSKFAIDRCTEEDGCPDPTTDLLSFDEAPGSESPVGIYFPMDPIVDEKPDDRAAVAEKLAGTWTGANKVWVVGPDGQPLQEDVINLTQFTADGGMLIGAAGEIGRRVRLLENGTFSLMGTHTAMFGNWKATSANSFEGYATWLYHRPEEYASPGNPGNMTFAGTFYVVGEFTGTDTLTMKTKLNFAECEGNAYGELSDGIQRADDVESAYSVTFGWKRLTPPQDENVEHHAQVAENIAGVWHAHGVQVPIPNSLFRFSADGTAMMSTSVELGQSVLAIPNPGIEGFGDTVPFSAKGSNAAAYGSWKATGPDTFEVYLASLGHRDEPMDPVAINPGNLCLTARIYLKGRVVGDHLVMEPKWGHGCRLLGVSRSIAPCYRVTWLGIPLS